MNADLLLAFAAFAFATSITPGPNNVMLLASGANHGFVRTLPHMAGITLGCALMIVLVGFGSIGQGVLPLVLRHIGIAPERLTIVTAEDKGSAEAAKYGGYFITHDDRVLRKSGELRTLLPPSLQVVTLETFLEIFDDYEAGQR